MIRFLLLVMIAAAALVTGPLLAGNKGYVLIAIGSYTIEMTVISACLLALMLYAALLVLEALLGRLFGLRGATRRWFASRNSQKARIQLHNGLLALAEGEWARAEKLFHSSERRSDETLVQLFCAAEAANAQGADTRRDDYLQQAVTAHPEAGLAAGLLKARLQLRRGATAEAVSTLQALRIEHPKHAGLSKLLAEASLATDSSAAPAALLAPQPTADAEALALYRQALCAAGSDLNALQQHWQQIPKSWRQRTELQAVYGRQLLQLGQEETAASLLQEWLRKAPATPLLDLIPDLTQPQPSLLATLQRHPATEPGMAQAIGWLLLLQRDYPQAQRQLEQALASQPDPRTYRALARLMEQQRLFEKASEYYRLSLAANPQQRG